jgi:adenylylsulfate kinase-like enzyme
VIWITGISGAGKTTVSRALADLLKPKLPELVLVDGDVVRAMYGDKLGFSEPERVTQIKRLQTVARSHDEKGQIAVVAALYAHPDLLRWNRQNFSQYFEVYLRAPFDLVEKRDAKGIYGRARKGEERNVVGVDIPWHAPEAPDLIIDAASGETPRDMALRIARAVPRLAAALPVEVR